MLGRSSGSFHSGFSPAQDGILLLQGFRWPRAPVGPSLVTWTAPGSSVLREPGAAGQCERIPTVISVNFTGFLVKIYNNLIGHVCN